MVRLFIAIALMLTAQRSSVAQPQTPAREETTAQVVVVRGRVVTDDDAAMPLRRARVAVVQDGNVSNTAFSDDLGRFELDVPASRSFMLSVSKAGFAPVALSGARLTVPVDVRLARGAAVTGRVVYATGLPMPATSVRLRRMDGVIDPAAPAERTTSTDDLGEYRFGSLPAARYVVQTAEYRVPATAVLTRPTPDGSPPTTVTSVFAVAVEPTERIVDLAPGEEEFVVLELATPDPFGALREQAAATGFVAGGAPASTRTGIITGVVVDQFGEPVEDAGVEIWEVVRNAVLPVLQSIPFARRTDDRGRYRAFNVPAGRYFIAAKPPPAAANDRDPLPSFYPGRSGLFDATELYLAEGQQVSAIDIVIAPAPAVRVHGLALADGGTPLAAGTVVPMLITPSETIALPAWQATIGERGRFELTVPPGNYVLQTVGKAASDHQQIGMLSLTAAGSEVGPVVITTYSGSTIRGTVTLEGGASSTPPPRSGLSMIPAQPEYSAAVRAYTGGFFENDWTFEMVGLTGPARFVLEGVPEDWWLKSVTVGAINAADDPVVLGTAAQSRTDVQVIIGTVGASIDGRVRIPTSPTERAPSYSVVVLPTQPERWYYKSKYMKTASVTRDGLFKLAGLPPGEYWVTAIDSRIVATTGHNSDVLRSLTPSARRVTLSEGQHVAVEIQPAPVSFSVGSIR